MYYGCWTWLQDALGSIAQLSHVHTIEHVPILFMFLHIK